MFFHMATLAGIEPLVALISEEMNYQDALKEVWEKVTDVTGLYCVFVSEALKSVLLASNGPAMEAEDLVIPEAPEADEHLLRFFEHPSSRLMRESNRLQARPAPRMRPKANNTSVPCYPGATRHQSRPRRI